MNATKLDMNRITKKMIKKYVDSPHTPLEWFLVKGVGYIACRQEDLHRFGVTANPSDQARGSVD